MRSWLVIIYCAFGGFVFAQDTIKVKPIAYDVSPQFPGGNGLLYEFVNNSIRFPSACLNDSTTAFRCRVYTKFKIDENGKVFGGEILKGCKYCPDCDKEALRVIALMPAWRPGIVNNKAVKSEICLPINFKVQ